MCLGLFVAVEDLEQMVTAQEEKIKSGAAPYTKPQKSVLQNQEVAYLKCPACETMMNRVNYGRISGVLIDYCREHGYWLDNGELEKIAKWVSTGGLAQKRQRDLDEARAQRSRDTAMSLPGPNASVQFDGESRNTGDFGDSLFRFLSKLFD